MSLLSSTQGTPERVYSLIHAISASGGSLTRAHASSWLDPGFSRNDQVISAVKSVAFDQVLGAATSLGAVLSDGGVLKLSPSCRVSSFQQFCDWVHQTLISLDSAEKDAVILETLAWVYVKSDRHRSTHWIHEMTPDAFADAADENLPAGDDDDGQRRINRTKLPSWRRWLLSLGLMVQLPSHSQPHPLPDERAAREVGKSSFSKNVQIPAKEFLTTLASGLPYIDGGRMFVDAARRIDQLPSVDRLSPILSATLRNLHDDGSIELVVRGDAGAALVRLANETAHTVQAFQAVIVRE